jgi:hypothetical protein
MKMAFFSRIAICLSKCQILSEHVIVSCCLAFFLDRVLIFFFLRIYFLYIIKVLYREHCHSALETGSTDKMWGA